MKDNGKTVKDTDLGWKLEVDGYTGVSGRKVLRVGTVLGNRTHQQQNTKELGPMDCRTVMDLRLMLTMVSYFSILSADIEVICKMYLTTLIGAVGQEK